ncbi:hypothetical protein DP73_04780 [Desulfosporosinus sp. HMP52]|uniref:glycosyltransferase family 4 protein n=1 Tax=Desulfosporosinus sp. HMP52 TaxID=1487923 RepID=UPI00051FC36F|nr:glycosyltransferase family 4 protein [Desulfosporosinus sp. HMP52]KGK91278.1 hypothetical protein DP73_04780 [Desulfosporosinus sp. HMP52]
MKKILIVSTVSRQFYLFEQGNIEVLHSLGYEVHAAANFRDANPRLDELNIVRHPFDIQRSPFSFKNIKAYKQLKEIMKSEDFDAVHCHSPMGSVLARLAARAVGISKVLYTPHGFHFYKDAPLLNWLLYYPIEVLLSLYTKVIITINQEDYSLAQKFKADKVCYIPGIGVNTQKFSSKNADRGKTRAMLEIAEETVVLLSVGELNKNKNHETVIRAVAKINDPRVIYLICGRGKLQAYLKNLVRSLGVEKKVRFLGFRNDVAEIYSASDIFVFPSYHEGLPVSVMEAMSAGLPVICSNIRGNTDLIENGQGGFLLNPKDVNGFAKFIKKVAEDRKLRLFMGQKNIETVKTFDVSKVKVKMKELYSEVILGD